MKVKGEMPEQRTMVFWVGLIIFCLASVFLFGIVWMAAVVMQPMHYYMEFWRGVVPFIVGGVVFLFLGVYMMKSSE